MEKIGWDKENSDMASWYISPVFSSLLLSVGRTENMINFALMIRLHYMTKERI